MEAPVGKIIIDARGTEKTVSAPPDNQGRSPETDLENPFIGKAGQVVTAVAGAVMSEIVDHVQKKVGSQEKHLDSFDFGLVEEKLMTEKLSDEGRDALLKKRKDLIDNFKSVDGGDFVNETKIRVEGIMEENDWDRVYMELYRYAGNREREMQSRAEISDNLNGIALAAIRDEAARVLVSGLDRQKRSLGEEGFAEWIKNKKADQYSEGEIEKIQQLTKRSFVRLAPDAPEELVGRSVKKDENIVPPEPQAQEIKVVLPEKDINTGFENQLQEKVRQLKKENAEPTEWAKVILNGIDFAETESNRESQKSSKNEKPEYWDALEKAIQEIPNNLGTIDEVSDLAKFLKKEYRNGLTFKDRMTILFTARKHLNDRFIEISRAGGSLTKMGVSDEMPFEGISYKVQPIGPEDFEMLYHTRELFPELGNLPTTELRELLPDLDDASCKWLDIGIKNNSIPEDIMTNEEVGVIRKILDNKAIIINFYQDQFKQGKIDKKERDKKTSEITKMSIDSNWVSFEVFMKPLMDQQILERDEILTYAYIPTFDNSLNNATTGAELRERIATSLRDSKSEDLAFRILTCTLTFEMLDRGRTNVQGSSEPRDIMWLERKRLFEMMKEREPGLDWTVHRYFVARPDPEEVINEDEARKSKKLAYRREILAINAERGVLVEKNDHFEGEVFSDFFHNVMVFAPDELKMGKNIRRNLATYVLNADGSLKKGGFKDMPFLKTGPDAYSTAGYWGYSIVKAKQIVNEMSSITYKKAEEELTTDDWWNKKRDLFGRLEHISPRLIIIEYKTRGQEIRKLLNEDGRFEASEVNKILGYSTATDLDVISDEGLRNEAIRIVTDTKNNIANNAKEKSEKLRDQVIDEFRLVHALGVVWPGSIDATEQTSTALSSSAISPELLTKIIRAIKASRYLEGDYLEHFKLECAEMGFGKKFIKRKPRYRNNGDASLWN